MKQVSFSEVERSGQKRVTQKDRFLEEMNQVIPWQDWISRVQPYYPAGKRGRKPREMEKMLRIYLLQLWFHLSGDGVEDAVCDSYAMHRFTGIDFVNEQVPDATTILKFRHIMVDNGLQEAFSRELKAILAQKGVTVRTRPVTEPMLIHLRKKEASDEGKKEPSTNHASET